MCKKLLFCVMLEGGAIVASPSLCLYGIKIDVSSKSIKIA